MYEVKLRNYREGLKHVSSIDVLCLKVVPVIGDLVNVTPLTSGRMISTFHIAETHLFDSSHLHIFNKSLSDFAVENYMPISSPWLSSITWSHFNVSSRSAIFLS
jgi:hypothetical protein